MNSFHVFGDPITNSDTYGAHTRGQVTAAADKVLAGQTDEEKQAAIKTKINEIESKSTSRAYISLRNQILDKSKENEANERLEASFKGEEGEHDDYKILATDLDFDGTAYGKLVVNYKYTVQQKDQNPEERSFKVTMEPNGGGVTHKILGKNLGIKDPGRGVTVSANNEDSRTAIENAKTNPNNRINEVTSTPDSTGTAFNSDQQRHGVANSEHYSEQDSIKSIKFNASHLIADWFNGSGYASALNLVQTSEYYNKKIMNKMEKQIVAELNNEQLRVTSLNSNAKYITFNALVTSEWMEIVDNKIADKIKNETAAAMKAGSNAEKEEILKKLVTDLGKERDPKFCKSVSYVISGVVAKDANGIDSGVSSSYNFNQKIGEDTHLKDILK